MKIRKKIFVQSICKDCERYQNPKKKHIKASSFFSRLKMLTSPLIVANCVLFRDFRYSL